MTGKPVNPSKVKNFFDEDQEEDFSSYIKKSSNSFDVDDVESPMTQKSSVNRNHTEPKNLRHSFPDDVGQEKMLTRRELYLQELQEIQDRTIRTTDKSLKILDDTEAIGTVAAQELLIQREQLETANRNLDNMDDTLNQSQKHINHIKSIFGGVKNWWTGKNATSTSPALMAVNVEKKDSLRNLVDAAPTTARSVPSVSHYGDPTIKTGTLLPDENSSTFSVSNQKPTVLPTKQFEAVLDNNLDQMSSGLSRLKVLAAGLGDEIEEQNHLLDSMNSKSDRVGAKLSAQQKSLDQILGKKK